MAHWLKALLCCLAGAVPPAMDVAPAAPAGEILALPAPTGAPDEQPLARRPELPLSLGLRTLDGVCFRLLARGEPLPASFVGLFTTVEDDQPAATLELLVGERPLCEGNLPLGAAELAPLPVPSYRSFVQIEVAVEVAEDGAVALTAAEVEGRALGSDFARAEWRGHLLEAAPVPAGAPEAGGRLPGAVAPFSHSLARHLPVLLATRTVRLKGRDVVICQHQRREEERVGTGGVLWEAAIALADHVGRGTAVWHGRRVLELGAGTGLVAIALALEGARVLATDGNPRVLEGAGRNAARAAGAFPAPGRVDLEVFDWNSPEDLARVRAAGPWDAVVGSDLVYPGNAGRACVASNAARHPADETLLGLFSALAGPSTEVVLALKDRTGEVGRFLRVAEASGWVARRAAGEELMPDFRSMDALAVLWLRRAGP